MARAVQIGDGIGDYYCDGLWDPQFDIPERAYHLLGKTADLGGGTFDLACGITKAFNDLEEHWIWVRDYRAVQSRIKNNEMIITNLVNFETKPIFGNERLMEIYHLLRGIRFVLPKSEGLTLLPIIQEVEEHVEDLNLLYYKDERLAEFNKNIHSLATPLCVFFSGQKMKLNIPCRGKVKFYRKGAFQSRNTITVLLAGPEDDQGFILKEAKNLIGHAFDDVVIDDLIENQRTHIPDATVVGWTDWEVSKPGYSTAAVLALRVPTAFKDIPTTSSEFPTCYNSNEVKSVPRVSLKLRKVKEINKAIEETVTLKPARILDVWIARLMTGVPIPGLPSFKEPVQPQSLVPTTP